MAIRLLSVDVDGTITNGRNQVTQAPADAAADGFPVVQHLVPTPCGAYHHACEPFSHRLFFVLLPRLPRHLFADPFQERENTLGEAHDGFVTF